MTRTGLPSASSVLAVCAHPDDESFGLGGILAAFGDDGVRTSLLCFTHGEASTLHGDDGDLAEVRADELAAAAAVLGVAEITLLDHPDGGLCDRPIGMLADQVSEAAERVAADLYLVFDAGGITGHPDHVCATRAALNAARARSTPVLAWALAREVAAAVNERFGTGMVGRAADEIDLVVTVDRERQRRAIACHRSQSTHNPVLDLRLERSGEIEHLRWLPRGPGSP